MLARNPALLSGPGRGWGAHLLCLLSNSLGHDIRLARAGGAIHDEGLATRPCEVVSDPPQCRLARRRGSVLICAHLGKPEVEPALVREGLGFHCKLRIHLVQRAQQQLAEIVEKFSEVAYVLRAGRVDSALLPLERRVPRGVLIQVGGLSQAAPQVPQLVDAVLGYLLVVNVNEILELVCLGVQVLDFCEGALEDVDAVLDLLLMEPEKGPGYLLLCD